MVKTITSLFILIFVKLPQEINDFPIILSYND